MQQRAGIGPVHESIGRKPPAPSLHTYQGQLDTKDEGDRNRLCILPAARGEAGRARRRLARPERLMGRPAAARHWLAGLCRRRPRPGRDGARRLRLARTAQGRKTGSQLDFGVQMAQARALERGALPLRAGAAQLEPRASGAQQPGGRLRGARAGSRRRSRPTAGAARSPPATAGVEAELQPLSRVLGLPAEEARDAEPAAPAGRRGPRGTPPADAPPPESAPA